jgi:uncharacterized spore protein YtfJ
VTEFDLAASVEALFGNLEKVADTRRVFGEPVTVGEATLIPVIELSFGLGAGGGSGGCPNKESGAGAGGGVGARVAASAVIVIRGDQVQVMSIKKSAALDKLVEMVPGIVDRLRPASKEGVVAGADQA